LQALILVGGEGTRLRPLTLTTPKPALPLVDRPFMRYMVDWLVRHGIDDIVMACGFLPEGLRDALGEGEVGGARLRYVEEPEPLGTAGAIKFAEDLLDDRFLALNGDVLTDLDLSALMEQHERAGARATLALYPVEDPTAYGLVRRTEDGEILEFLEKPDPAEIDTDEISAGAYVLERDVLDLIPPGRSVSIEREVFPRLVGNGLYSRRLEGYWMDIGTPERFLQASWDILERRVDTEPGRMLDEGNRIVEEGATVDPGAKVGEAVLIQAPSSVAAGSEVGDRAVLGPACELNAAAVIEAALLGGCRLGPGSRVQGAILGAGVEVGEEATVSEGCVIGAGATIAAGATLEPGTKVQPEERVG
jgi:mannose-1-phosphate guanylyltransferase